MSRRATLKAVAVALFAGPLLGRPGRQPATGGLSVTRLAITDSSPSCNWSGAAADCLGVLGQQAACIATCVKTGVGCGGCMTTVRNQVRNCNNMLNCHCQTGQYCSSGWGVWGTCCDPPDVCVDPYGCQPPCGPCEQRQWSGSCKSTCTSSQTCCNGACVNTSIDPNNCGTCGNVCAGYPIESDCVNGQCCCQPTTVCPSGNCCPASGGLCNQACCAADNSCCMNEICIPNGYSCCSSGSAVFGCEYGCCGSGCVPDASAHCCFNTFACNGGDSCCMSSTGVGYCGNPNC